MSYNFMCETAIEPNWVDINKLMKKYDCLESFPMLESKGQCFGLAISIPMKNTGARSYKQFVSAYKVLSKNYNFKVYDMYYGNEVDKEHIKNLKQEIT
ncbi:MAG: hypothetical protein IJY79_00540 [Clostridia bacterium]|nr:hypothetical protein [Clostridia bacterium]